MKKVNWKGNLIALGIITGVGGVATWASISNNNQSTIDTHVQAASTSVSHNDTIADDNSNDITVAPYDGTDKIRIVDSNEKTDTTKQEEIQVNDPYQKVLRVLGEPDEKTVTKSSYGTHELWMYYSQGKGIFFDNGYVDSITENK